MDISTSSAYNCRFHSHYRFVHTSSSKVNLVIFVFLHVLFSINLILHAFRSTSPLLSKMVLLVLELIQLWRNKFLYVYPIVNLRCNQPLRYNRWCSRSSQSRCNQPKIVSEVVVVTYHKSLAAPLVPLECF